MLRFRSRRRFLKLESRRLLYCTWNWQKTPGTDIALAKGEAQGMSEMGSQRRISSDPYAQLRELEQLQLVLRAMEVSAMSAETDRSRSQPLRQRPVDEQNAQPIQEHAFSRSLPRLVEQHPGPVQAIAVSQQHSHAAERIGLPGFASFQGLPPPAPENARRALSGANSQPGASRYRSFSDNQPTSLLASGKLCVSSINSQLAALCEEERARARARPTETNRSPSQPLRQRHMVEQREPPIKQHSRSLPRLVEQHSGPVQAIAVSKQHSHEAERHGPRGCASSHLQGQPQPAPEDARRALSGASSKPGASQHRSFSDKNRPTSLPASGKVRVSGMNSQLAALCEEERDRARERLLSSKSPKVQPTPAVSVWLALGVLVLTVFAFLARLFTALTFYTRKREHTIAGSTADEHRNMAAQHRPKDKHAVGKSATAPRADSTFDKFRNVKSKNQLEETIAAAPRTSCFARHAIRPPEASPYSQPDKPKRRHNSTPRVTNMTVFV